MLRPVTVVTKWAYCVWPLSFLPFFFLFSSLLSLSSTFLLFPIKMILHPPWHFWNVPPAALLTTLFTLPLFPSCLPCCLLCAPVPPLCQRSSAPTNYLQTVRLRDEITPITDYLRFWRKLKSHLKKKKNCCWDNVWGEKWQCRLDMLYLSPSLHICASQDILSILFFSEYFLQIFSIFSIWKWFAGASWG